MAYLLRALAPDRITRSVWVVIDPRDAVTGARTSATLRVTLRGVTARPIVSGSGLYCFTDLDVATGRYVVDVQPVAAAESQYFAAQREFTLRVPPVAGAPLDRNLVTIDLLPRPAYPFGDRITIARARLVRRSNGTPIEGAAIDLIRPDRGVVRRGQTDERGDFAMAFPPEPPETDRQEPPSARAKMLPFQLEFIVSGRPPHRLDQQEIAEGASLSLGTLKFPTL